MRATATAAMWRPRRAAVRSAKARSGPGAFAADQAASTSACLAAAALLGDAALPRLGDARLAQLRVETEVAGEMPRTLEAADVADRSHQRRRGRHVHARDRHQPADLRRGERLLGDRPIDVREFVLQEVELAQASVDRPARRARARAPRATPDRPCRRRPRREGAPCRVRSSTAEISFFVLVDCFTSCRRRETSRRNSRVRSSPSPTRGTRSAASNSASVQTSIASVFTFASAIARTLRACASTTSPTCGAMMRAIASALPVASSTTRSSEPRLCANSSSSAGRAATRPAVPCRPPRSRPRRSRGGRPTR